MAGLFGGMFKYYNIGIYGIFVFRYFSFGVQVVMGQYSVYYSAQ
jgi:hypothetical protein